MKSQDLVSDYIFRASGRLKSIHTLMQESLWADTVRESQEVVELALKALLRHYRIDIPRIHDVSEILEQNKERFSARINENLEFLMNTSHDLRRDRELSFYGSEDITPHNFYKEKHAKVALDSATKVVEICKKDIERTP
jgi:HEPN domain-containing protein